METYVGKWRSMLENGELCKNGELSRKIENYHKNQEEER